MIKLMASFSKIKTFSLITREEAGNSSYVLASQTDTFVTNDDKFYSLLNVLVGNRKVSSCTAHFTNSEDDSFKISIRDDTNMFYKYCCTINKYFSENGHIYDEKYASSVSLALPLHTYRNGPNIINHLSFYVIEHEADEGVYSMKGILRQQFTYAQDNCPQLKTFAIEYHDPDGDFESVGYLSARQENGNQKAFLDEMTQGILRKIDESYRSKWIELVLDNFPNLTRLQYEVSEAEYSGTKDRLQVQIPISNKPLKVLRIDVEPFFKKRGEKHVYVALNKHHQMDAEYTQCFRFDEEHGTLLSVGMEAYNLHNDIPLEASFDIILDFDGHPDFIELGGNRLLDFKSVLGKKYKEQFRVDAFFFVQIRLF